MEIVSKDPIDPVTEWSPEKIPSSEGSLSQPAGMGPRFQFAAHQRARWPLHLPREKR
jgi:hypothetical protein